MISVFFCSTKIPFPFSIASQVPAVHAQFSANRVYPGSGTYTLFPWTTNGGKAPFMDSNLFSGPSGTFTALQSGKTR